jgi:hypothetical protein
MNRKHNRKIYGMVPAKEAVLLIFVMLLFSFTSYSQQIEKGAILNLGLGNIRSNNLNKLVGTFKQNDTLITTSDAHSSLGGSIGIGGWVRYPLNPKLSLLAELSLNYQSSKIFINYVWDSLDVNKSGTKHRISSDASIRMFYINLPILLRYKVFENKQYYVLGGLTFNITPHPHIKSYEEDITTQYLNDMTYKTTVVKVNEKATLDKYGALNMFLTLGVEKGFRKKMFLSFKFNLPINASTLYTSNSSFYNNSLNNALFSAQGKMMAEGFTHILLNDFKRTSFVFSVNYKISKKKS